MERTNQRTIFFGFLVQGHDLVVNQLLLLSLPIGLVHFHREILDDLKEYKLISYQQNRNQKIVGNILIFDRYLRIRVSFGIPKKYELE
jgi:hypothetical protein